MTLSLPISSSSSSSSFFFSATKLSLSLPFSLHCTKWPRLNSFNAVLNSPAKEKLVVIMGATGSGKSGLSVNLASHFPSEIINSDKMQVYKGLDITTNKIPVNERNGVTHHLLGDIDSLAGEFSPAKFRVNAGNVVSDITSRMKLPILVGGSNSFIHSLLVNRFDPNSDVFTDSNFISSDLRYNCCFLWVNVEFQVLSEYLSVRVDDMLKLGMFEELSEFYNADESDSGIGIRKAIGVPEFDRYFKKYPPDKRISPENLQEILKRREAYEEVVKMIKENTNVLAKKQIWKILQLRKAWDIKILDATAAVKAALKSEPEKRSELWEKNVFEPSLQIVKSFLRD